MDATLPNAMSSTSVVTRYRKRRDLETTMNTLKQLLEPTLSITSKKGSRKKSKPRKKSKSKKVSPLKTIKRFEAEDDREYYPNKLKRKLKFNKTILKPRHELKVVVATNKRKRGTPVKGLKSIYEETPDKQPPDINEHTKPNKSNVYTAPDSNVNTDLNVHVIPGSNVHTALGSNVNEAPASNVHNVLGSDVNKTPGSNIHTAPSNNVFTASELNVQTPPPSLNPDIYELISPPHKSLTQMTADDLIRMDEDSLSDEDLMEILTCPSPVWWEEPTNKNKGTIYLTTASEILEPTEFTNSRKHTIKIKTYSNKKAGFKRTGTVSVSVNKAKKITKLENILGRIKNLVRTDDKLDNNIRESLKHNDNIAKDDINENKHNKNSDKDDTDENNGDKIKQNEIIDEIDSNYSKRRTISSSGSEISVNEDDLIRNLERIDIPIQKLSTDSVIDLNNDVDINEESITAGNKKTPNSEVEEKSRNECVEAIIGSLIHNKSDEITPVSKIQNKSNKKDTEHRNRYYGSNKTDVPDIPLDSNDAPESGSRKKPSKSNNSLLRKLQNPNDDILDVRLIKIPTNATNEVKIWSKLDNFKRHNFKPTDFECHVIDIEDELAFSMIKTSPDKEGDPLDTRGESILIDDDSNDALHLNKSLNDKINFDVVEQCNVVTITAENDESSQNSEPIEIDEPKVVDNNQIIKEDMIRIGNDLDVRLIETSDVQNALVKPKRKRKMAVSKRQKNIKGNVQGARILPRTFESFKLSHDNDPKESKWHINNYLQYGEQSNERGIFRVLDTEDSTDTILRFEDVDASLVNNLRPEDLSEADISETDISTVKMNKITENRDLSITLISNTDVKGTNKPTIESPKSAKSVSSKGNVDYYEDTISDSNIQFLDEYVVKIDEDDSSELQSTPEEREIEGAPKDPDQNENSTADIDGEIESRQDFNRKEINVNISGDSDSESEEEDPEKVQDLSNLDIKQTNSDENCNSPQAFIVNVLSNVEDNVKITKFIK